MPKAEAEAGIEQQTVGLQARLMSQALRKITQVVGRSQSTVIFTNQMRDKIGVSYGDKTTTPGGNALKYYASIRIKLQKLGMNSEGDDKVSVRVKATCVKNKTFPPFKECEFVIAFGTGVDELEAALDTIVNNKVVDKKGSWISYKGENICQGRPALKEMLKNNEALKNEMLAAVKGKLVVDAEPTAEEKEDAEADESKAPDVVAPTQDSNAVETGEV